MTEFWFRRRSGKTTTQPETNAAIIYMMDVSGSMTDEQKEIVRIEAFWIDTWLQSQYDGVDEKTAGSDGFFCTPEAHSLPP